MRVLLGLIAALVMCSGPNAPVEVAGQRVSLASLRSSTEVTRSATLSTVSFTTTPDSWVLLFGVVRGSTNLGPMPDFVVSNTLDLTFVKVAEAMSGPARRAVLYAAYADGAVTGSATVSLGSYVPSDLILLAFDVMGIESGAVNEVMRFTETAENAGMVTSYSAALPEGTSPANPVFGLFYIGGGTVATPGQGWILLGQQATGNALAFMQWRYGGSGVVNDCSWIEPSHVGGVLGVEMRVLGSDPFP